MAMATQQPTLSVWMGRCSASADCAAEADMAGAAAARVGWPLGADLRSLVSTRLYNDWVRDGWVRDG